jgi:hypothetical protein
MSVDRFVTIVHPGAEDASPVVSLAPRLRTLSGARLALIDNAKHMAGVFLGELGRELVARHGVASLEVYWKANASIPTPPDVLSRLLASYDGLVHGVAD